MKKTEESGRRIKVSGTVNARANNAYVLDLCRYLARVYGGCSVVEGGGCWVDDAGTLMTEPATVVSVSFMATDDDPDYIGGPAQVERVRRAVTLAQEATGGEWTHLEVSEFDAAHTHIDHLWGNA